MENFNKAQHIEKRAQQLIEVPDSAVRYVSIKEYAKILGISTSTAYALVAGGAAQGAVKLGRIWRVPVR